MSEETNQNAVSKFGEHHRIEDKLLTNFSYIGGFVLTKATKMEISANKEIHNTDNLKNNHIISIVYQLQGMVTILLTSALFVFLARHTKLRKRNSTKLFMNLQLVHLCMATTNIIGQHTKGNIAPCINNGFLLGLFLGMLVVTVDRHAQIHSPMTYQHERTKHILLAVVLSNWILVFIFNCIIIAYAAFRSQHFLTILSTVLLTTTHVVLVFTNASVMNVAKRHHKHIQSMCKISTVDSTRRQKQSLKATKTCITIVGSFLLLWLPFLIHNLLALGGFYIVDGNKLFSQIAQIAALSNATVDQVLFVAFHREVKQTASKYLQKKSFNNYGSDYHTSNKGSSVSNKTTSTTTQ